LFDIVVFFGSLYLIYFLLEGIAVVLDGVISIVLVLIKYSIPIISGLYIGKKLYNKYIKTKKDKEKSITDSNDIIDIKTIKE
jgi:tetrahydromethanopterin S-methyltransferase subunit E